MFNLFYPACIYRALISFLFILLIMLSFTGDNSLFIYNFIAFSAQSVNKSHGASDPGAEDKKYPDNKGISEEPMFYQNSSDMDEKTLEFYIKRDMYFNGVDCYDDCTFEKLPPEIGNQLKETLTKIIKEKIENRFNSLRKAPKDSIAKKYILKDNWEELFNNGQSPFKDDILKSESNDKLMGKETLKLKAKKLSKDKSFELLMISSVFYEIVILLLKYKNIISDKKPDINKKPSTNKKSSTNKSPFSVGGKRSYQTLISFPVGEKSPYSINKHTIGDSLTSKTSVALVKAEAQPEGNYSGGVSSENNGINKNDDFLIDKNTPFLTYSPVYLKLKEIFQDANKNNSDKQKEVELLVNQEWLKLYFYNENKYENEKTFLLLNKAMKSFLVKLDEYFNSKKKFTKILPLIEMKKHDIAFVVFNELKPILNQDLEISNTTLSGNIGKSLYNRWIREKFIEEKKSNKDINFNSFKDNFFIKEEQYHEVGDLLILLLLQDNNLFFRRVDKIDPKNTQVLITSSSEVKDIFKHHNDVIGFKLAMIVPPVKWSDNTYGGYLRNNEILFRDLITPSNKSKIKSIIDNNLIYNSVNYLSSIPYKINSKLLEFIERNSKELGLLSDLHVETKNLENYYSALNVKKTLKGVGAGEKVNKFKIKTTIKEILNHNSNYYLQKNILGLAGLYNLLDEFYFTINLDWRGRLYSESTYLNFQGNELSKALLYFKNGTILSDEGLYYLKIYGANLYGMNKYSFQERIKWVDDNHDNIISMNIDFINKADKKFIFIAFCLEYKNYVLNPKEFISHLPILFDASCNGMQHLAAMIGDSVIAKNVNLLESDPYIKPYDFYNFCLNLVKEKLANIDPNNPHYIRIRQLKIDRCVVKRTIMTIPYNVSIHTMSNQLKEFFEEVEINNKILLKPSWYIPESEIYISQVELYYLAKLIHETLYEEHPKLKGIVKYFSDIATLLTDLNLPIVWKTPAGLTVKQNYIKFKKHVVKSSLFYKSSSYTITIPTSKISVKDQKAAFMPNLIHSMDASNIYLLIDKVLRDNLNINLFTVHDCFATTSENMPLINRLVRSSFIELYSDNDYLNKLNNFYLNYISDSGYSIENNKVILENKALDIPVPPITDNLQLINMVDKAIYLIH